MIRRLHLPDSAAPVEGAKLYAPSAARNLEAIRAVLVEHAPREGRALELASGTGEHIVEFAAALPGLHWQPTEPVALRRASIDARVAEAGLGNLAPAVELDACAPGWAMAQGPLDLVLLVNLLHLISDAEMAVLLDEAAQVLAPGGVFAVYGPFLRDGVATSDGDAAFDASLRAQDGAIGYKDLDAVATVLDVLGLRVRLREMPANNVMILARRP